MLRWRTDKTAEDADTLDRVKALLNVVAGADESEAHSEGGQRGQAIGRVRLRAEETGEESADSSRILDKEHEMEKRIQQEEGTISARNSMHGQCLT